MNLSKYFTLLELTKSTNAIRLGISNEPNTITLDKLEALCLNIGDPIREYFGKPVSVNSGFRSPELNAATKGSKTSQHMKGEAMDIEIIGVSNGDLAAWIYNNLEYDQLILEFHHEDDPSSGWVHISYCEGKNRKQALITSNGKEYYEWSPTS